MHQTSLQPNGQPRPLRVGMLGLGTVGSGTYRVLQRNQELIFARSGRAIAITTVAVRDLAKARQIVDPAVTLLTDPFAVASHPDVDVVVETIGGTTLAKDLVLTAIASGKHVVTANKALLAEHGNQIFSAAQAKGVVVAYEGAVAVSIPIIKALRECLTANRIEWIAGIINGTSNYILSQMKEHDMPFALALQEAQRLGFAESDPSFDVKGIDAGHKLAILAANAFGTPIQFDQVSIQGIDGLQQRDVQYANRLGYSVKLLGIARHNTSGIAMEVRPTLLPEGHLLTHVNGSMNGILVKADAAGLQMFYGAGAGSEQTGSSVIADLVDIARMHGNGVANTVPALGFQPQSQRVRAASAMVDGASTYYMRCSCEGASLVQGIQRITALQSLVAHQVDYADTDDGSRSDLVLITTVLSAADLLRLKAALAEVAAAGSEVTLIPIHTYA